MSDTSNWLANLSEYDCPTCSKKTIFKDGCVDCETKASDLEEIENLKKEIKDLQKEEVELQARRVKAHIRLSLLENKPKVN